jgi:autotransporter translocation and assembly factor TamB
MQRVSKILGWTAMGLGALIAITIVAAVTITNTEWFRDFARAKVNAVLAGTFKGQLAIGRIHGSIWSELTVDDITLTYRGERIAHIERLRAAYGILSILQNTIDLTHLDISGLELSAKQDEDGKWNAVEALASARPEARTQNGGKTRFRVLIREVSLGRGSINVTRANSETYALDDAGLGGSIYILQDGLRVKLDSLWGHVSGPQLPPGDLFATLTYETALHPSSVKIDVVKIDTHDSHLQLTGAVTDLAALKMDVRLEAKEIGGADIATVAKQWSPHANISGTVRIQGTRPDLHLTLALNAANAKIRGDVHTDISKREPRYRGSVDVLDLNPQQLLTIKTTSGVLNASVRGQGTGTSVAGFDGHVGLRVARLGVEQWNVGDLIFDADVANRIATYQAKIAQGQRASATSRGRVDFRSRPQYLITLAANHLNAQKFQNRRLMHTDLNLAAQVKGSGITLDDADAVARVDVKRSVLGPASIDGGAVRASIARGLVRIAQASISAGATKFNAKGQLAMAGSRRGDLTYNLTSDDISPWLTLAGRSGAGSLQVIGRASGPFNALTVNGSASMGSLKTEGVSIGAGKVTYAFADVGNDRAHGRLDASFGQVHTNVDLNAVYVGVDLIRLRPTDARVLVNTWDAQSRNQRIAGEIRLQPNVIDVSLTQLALQMADGTWQLPHPAIIHKDGKQLAVQNLRLVNAQKEISVQGQVAFGGAQDVSLLVNGFDLADLNPFIASNPEITGTLSSSIRITGTSAMPIVTARMQIKPLAARGYTLTEVDANAKYTSGQMVADAEIYQDAAHQLIANATIPMQLGWDRRFIAYASGGINGRVHSNGISLAFLNSLGPRTVRGLDGNISMDIALTGPIKRPQASGGIWLWGGKAKVVPAGITIDALNMTVLISPQAIFVQDLNARSKDGSIDAWGRVALDGYRPGAVDVSLKMDKWPAINTPEYVAYTAADLHLSGTPEAPKLGGKVELLWGVLKPDLAFLGGDTVKEDRTIEVVYDGVAPPPPPPAPPSPFANLFQNLAIDLIAQVHRDTWVKVAGSSAELEGKVRVLKNSGGPLTLLGGIHTVRGQIAIAGQPLDLQKGEATFTGGAEIDPSLDIVAQRKLPQYTVSANIGGTAKKPSLTFSSDPQMSQADILSVLMFGRPTSQLSNNQQASLQSQAATIAGSYAANQIGQSVADALGLQALQFSVENGMAAVGTYLTQDVFLSASQNVTPQTQQIPGQPSQKATIQYYLTQHFEVDTSQSRSSLGNASELNLIWHTQY